MVRQSGINFSDSLKTFSEKKEEVQNLSYEILASDLDNSLKNAVINQKFPDTLPTDFEVGNQKSLQRLMHMK